MFIFFVWLSFTCFACFLLKCAKRLILIVLRFVQLSHCSAYVKALKLSHVRLAAWRERGAARKSERLLSAPADMMLLIIFFLPSVTAR